MTRSVLATMSINTPDVTTMRAAFQKIADALTEVGVIKESTVTGQIDIPTSAYPGALTATTFFQIGYEVRKLVQAGLPTIFMRIDYQVYSFNTANTGANMVIRINFGTAVSSAGVLSGMRSTSWMSNAGNQTAALTASYPVVIASDGKNYLTMILAPNVNSGLASAVGALTLTMERTRDRSSGLYDNNGWIFVNSCVYNTTLDSLTSVGTSSSRVTYINLLTSQNAFMTNPTFASIGTAWGTVSGTGDAASLSPFPVGMPTLKGVASCILGYWASEITAGSEFNVSLYGATMRFVAFGAVGQNTNDTALSTQMRAAFRCD